MLITLLEDTFALLDALEKDAKKLRQMAEMKNLLTAEIGCGSGCASSFLKSGILKNKPIVHFMSDISNSACRASKITALNNRELYKDDNGLFITVQTSFLDGIRLGNGVDILIFNPPYVPTEFEEIPSEAATIASAWAGGTDGMDVTSTLLNQLKDILSQDGVFYMVAVARNKLHSICEILQKDGFIVNETLKRKAGRETLSILRIYRIGNTIWDE